MTDTINLSGLLPLLSEQTAFQQLARELNALHDGRAAWRLPVLRAARPLLLAALAQHASADRPLLVIAAKPDRAQALYESLRAYGLATPDRLLRFPEPSALFYERAPWPREVVAERLQVLDKLTNNLSEVANPHAGAPIIVASVRAVMFRTLPTRAFHLGTRTLKRNQTISLDQLLETWVGFGYESVSTVLSPGEFSRRGGIIDVFPPVLPRPVRIEFFGDEVESLRAFDPASQRSLEALAQVIITPATELLPKNGPLAAEKIKTWDTSVLPDDQAELFEKDRKGLIGGVPFRGIEFYLPLLHSDAPSLLDYLPRKAIIALDDADEIADHWSELEEQAIDLRRSAEEDHALPPDFPLPYLTWDEWREKLAGRSRLSLGEELHPDDEPAPASALPLSPGQRFGGQLKPLIEHIGQMRTMNDAVIVVSRQAGRLAELWAERDHLRPPVHSLTDQPQPRALIFVQGLLDEGWTLRGIAPRDENERRSVGLWSLHVITDAEIFGWSRPQPRRRGKPKAITPEQFFADLQPGDYVVHIDHGIGIFQGLIKLTLEGIENEYLQVAYASGDKLYVPIHQADRLSKYIGAEDHAPEIHRLGTADWGQVRSKAKEAALAVARELLELYAVRELAPGFAFSADTPWQNELEASFPYLETEDQLRAIRAVKDDMQKPQPMDRLICGDVGYGKTEVALRAAFKAVQDGRQVAVLVPTTILAQQHYTTFTTRLAAFPVSVEMLSRFRSEKEQDAILHRLREGNVDILIGTHRLLQQDVLFKDLGLLIIDEEQRFGVTHKEQLKKMRTEVDVLTLTATPIPRTLYMSLVGVRDISTIDTPPEERLPVATYVGEYDDHLVRQAILRELDRGGQVFFVHNRVLGIEQIADRLAKIVPEARTGTGHGQMDEHALEKVMIDFVKGDIDVLLCTSIIESGLDIPNANTLIVDRADRFGLAQLYQLRGRVGRGATRAYAYFLYDKASGMTDDARRRLEAIREASELGMGYSIAMRDLEIRGAGDLLGMRQSGHISAVGFDLYTKLLQRSVTEMKALRDGTPAPAMPLTGVNIDLPLQAHVPTDYVMNEGLRLQLYRRMGNITAAEEIDALAQELADRFGPPPKAVENLMFQLHLKVLAARAQVSAIVRDRERNNLVLKCEALEHADRLSLQKKLGSAASVQRREVHLANDETWRIKLVKVLQEISDL
ncbi:Transcription-repair-coupling factor [Thermoflexales bacterium]|nr:Transcription-repair-coupling factor [Thermoflexales bacterium]